jgi:hypothetical protein
MVNSVMVNSVEDCRLVIEAQKDNIQALRAKLDALHAIRPTFELGAIVALKLQQADAWAGGQPTKGIITAIHIRPGMTSYSVTWADNRQKTSHFEMELTPAEASE